MHRNFLYFDIETSSNYIDIESFKLNDEKGYELFLKKYKANKWADELPLEQAYEKYGAIFSTYGKIVCISYGYFTSKNETGYTIKSITGDEKQIIETFKKLTETAFDKQMSLCGYNIIAFDIPYVFRKMITHDIRPSHLLSLIGKKPWELPFVDILEDWKQKFRYMLSLDEVCYELGIPSPKEECSGSDVHDLFFKNDIASIARYCERDVLSTMLIAKKIYND